MNTINVVLICDDNYVLPTVVAMTSIRENIHPSRELIFYVLCDNIKKQNESILREIECGNIRVIIKKVDSSRYKGLEKSYSSVSKSSLLKFSIPNEISEDKALYIDGDIIAQKDISSLYDLDISDNYAAVVRDGPKPPKVPGGKEHAYYGNPDYFNSGVMLLNLKKLRTENITDKLIDFRLNQYNYFMDQDAFNKVFGNNVIQIGVENDFMLHLISYRNETYSLKQLIDFYNLKEYKTIDELLDNVVIFHYTFDKPWKYYDIVGASLWYHYFKKSPMKDVLLNRSSFITERIYNTKTYTFSRRLSKVVRTILRIK